MGTDKVHYGSIITSNIDGPCCCLVQAAATQLGLEEADRGEIRLSKQHSGSEINNVL